MSQAKPHEAGFEITGFCPDTPADFTQRFHLIDKAKECLPQEVYVYLAPIPSGFEWCRHDWYELTPASRRKLAKALGVGSVNEYVCSASGRLVE